MKHIGTTVRKRGTRKPNARILKSTLNKFEQSTGLLPQHIEGIFYQTVGTYSPIATNKQ